MMKKVTFRNLDAYRLSTEEKKNVIGGWYYDNTCLDCAPGWVKVLDYCTYVECKNCNSLPANYPGCDWDIDEPIDCSTEIDEIG